MLRGLDDFMRKPMAYKKKFLYNCYIQEKVSAFYFHVRILSANRVIVYKSDYKEIKVEDVVLNKMWKDPVEEIPEMFLKNPEISLQMVGWTLSFFYFPVAKPLVVEYDLSEGWKYMLAFATDEHKVPVDISKIDLSIISPLIRSKSYLLKGSSRSDREKAYIDQVLRENTVDAVLKWIEKTIEKSEQESKNMIASSLNNSEGVVLRWKKDIYQVVYNSLEEETKDNRLSLEFFIHSFCQWLSETEYEELVKSTYLASVCSLFCEFKKSWLDDKEKMKTFNYYNIKAEDLEAPTFGYYPGTCYDLIPNKLVREWCIKDKMDDNMFKILLNGLKKPRRNSNSMLVSEEDTIVWNGCVKMIKSYTNPLGYLNNKKNSK